MKLQMPSFISDYFKRKEGVKIYEEKLNSFLSDQKLSDEEKQGLEKIISDYGVKNEQLYEIKKASLLSAFNKLTTDKRLPKDRLDALDGLMEYFGIGVSASGIDANLIRKYNTLSLIDEGKLPDVTEAAKNELDILYKAGEILHFRAYSQLRKFKRVTKTIQYKGLTASIKITKSWRYRAGSLNLNRITQEFLAVDDSGLFYITNKRVGYHGKRKQFSVFIEKVSSFELRPEGLFIFKEGKETPYILTLADYEVPLTMVSFLLDKEEK